MENENKDHIGIIDYARQKKKLKFKDVFQQLFSDYIEWLSLFKAKRMAKNKNPN